jgi:predicted metalloprotease with PDZ domain
MLFSQELKKTLLRLSPLTAAVRTLLMALLLAHLAAPATAQQALPDPPPLPVPQDRPYPGVIRLDVDASSVTQHIFRVRETVPVSGAGDFVLLYPEWFPGNHSPSGRSRLGRVAGLTVSSQGKAIAWSRDPVNMFAFHVQVPPATQVLEVELQYLAPPSSDYGRIDMRANILTLDWNAVVLYPAGYYVRQIPIEATLTVPESWQLASALERVPAGAGRVSFERTSLETLIDSPVYAGAHFVRQNLTPAGSRRPVYLDLFGDAPEQLVMSPAEATAHKALVEQAYRLFGAQHYDHYDFLVTVSEVLPGGGVEHHRSSFDGVPGNYLTEWSKSVPSHDLLAHEFVHSWNGKFRRPADLWTPTYNVPMRNSLLWIYEGLTEYWGYVLSARAGLHERPQALDELALIAARYQGEAGHQWRPLTDTTDQPIIAYREPQPWRSWQRATDYYDVGLLIWLDADTLIRERSHGARSLDDFARRFFGSDDGSYADVTYTLADVVAALNRIEPYDWERFFHERVEAVTGAPLEGLARGGYRLAFTDTPSELYRLQEERAKQTAFTYSLGLSVDHEGRIRDVLWDGPAFKAGLAPGTQIVAVNGIAFGADRLKEQVRSAVQGHDPLSLIVRDGDAFRTVTLDYHGGLRYPRLERAPGEGAHPLLDAILAPRA